MKKISIFLSFLLLLACGQQKVDENSFTFVLACDMRGYTGDNLDHFRGACEAIAQMENIEFMISPGDIDPPDAVYSTIQKYIGTDMPWYPVVGNHEIESSIDMQWLREYNKDGNTLPNIVNTGPAITQETTYSFDFKNTHFVILNQYATGSCDDCTNGDVPDFLYNWLKDDLSKTDKENILVVGHEPAYPFPDIENQRFRHTDDCLNQNPENRDRFVDLLQEYNVRAYLVGHTHNYSIVKVNSLWHIDAGHARGIGDMGARSAFVIINVRGDQIGYETYRLNYENKKYELADSGDLN
jgi:hypothetical protein